VCVCLLLQDLVQSCLRWGGGGYWVRSVTDSKNLFIGQYDKFFEEYWLSPIL
jgi:hypothetical protein